MVKLTLKFVKLKYRRRRYGHTQPQRFLYRNVSGIVLNSTTPITGPSRKKTKSKKERTILLDSYNNNKEKERKVRKRRRPQPISRQPVWIGGTKEGV